jgi:phosphoadenosine phosphosulfate reductase
MTSEEIKQANEELGGKTPQEIANWAVEKSGGSILVSTNFRPFEAVILHLCVQAKPDLPVLWMDGGWNQPATYRHAHEVIEKLKLNVTIYTPKMTHAHWHAVHGEAIPTPDDETFKDFSYQTKLEPFQRGLKEMAPKFWITGLRRVQNPNRANLDVVSEDVMFGTDVKINPAFNMSDDDMEAYLKEFDLPNELDYFDPVKADEKRECGLHVSAAK